MAADLLFALTAAESKLSVEGEEITNEAYSATSYPFSSSDKTMDFGIYGLVPAEVISSDGSSKSYATVKQAWNEAKDIEGSTVKLSRNSTIKGTLEVEKNMRIDLNGCLLANAEVGSLFSVKSGGNLSIVDSDPERDTGEDFLVTLGMKSEDDADSRKYHLTVDRRRNFPRRLGGKRRRGQDRARRRDVC